jgi:hypothetical protein
MSLICSLANDAKRNRTVVVRPMWRARSMTSLASSGTVLVRTLSGVALAKEAAPESPKGSPSPESTSAPVTPSAPVRFTVLRGGKDVE